MQIMKYLSTIISILLAIGQGYAQNIEGNYQYRVGDEIRKQIVAYEATVKIFGARDNGYKSLYRMINDIALGHIL